ncbi:hypothetical protein [Sphingobacterium detergens]|nr:hypothetical protein [Sphingobacterium detergens]
MNSYDIHSEKGKRTAILFNGNALKIKDFSIEFDVTPKNSQSKFGIIASYQNSKDWLYIGCDSTSDVLTHSHWNLRRPHAKMLLDKDIVKFYKDFKRHVMIKLEGTVVTVYVDGEKIIQQQADDLQTKAGSIGFMVHNGGAVHLANVRLSEIKPRAEKEVTALPILLQNKELEVTFAKEYPAVIQYTLLNRGVQVDGMQSNKRTFSINGIEYQGISIAKKQGEQLVYQTTLPQIKVSFDTEFSLQGKHLQMQVTNLKETGTLKVKTLAFPNHDLVRIKQSPDAQLSIAHGAEKDEYFRLSALVPNASSKSASIAILNTKQVAATILSNSIYNAEQIRYRTIEHHGQQSTSLFSEEWIIRGIDRKILPLPQLTVILTEDSNQDGQVN